MLHLPGQLAIYPIWALDRLGLNLPDYVARLHHVLQALLDDFSIRGETRAQRPGLWTGGRPIAGVGVSVRDWVGYFGAWLNLNPDLDPLRLVRWGGTADEPMTSLVRERKLPLRPSMVRERLIEHVRAGFGFERVSLFSDHPALEGCCQRCHDAITIKDTR
jgi:lipoyl(octanoyl) transferase